MNIPEQLEWVGMLVIDEMEVSAAPNPIRLFPTSVTANVSSVA